MDNYKKANFITLSWLLIYLLGEFSYISRKLPGGFRIMFCKPIDRGEYVFQFDFKNLRFHRVSFLCGFLTTIIFVKCGYSKELLNSGYYPLIHYVLYENSWLTLTVSSRGTSFPGWPVKTSATWKGWDKNLWIFLARATVNLSSSDSSSIPKMAMISWSDL